jgi:hypothetical protein
MAGNFGRAMGGTVNQRLYSSQSENAGVEFEPVRRERGH